MNKATLYLFNQLRVSTTNYMRGTAIVIIKQGYVYSNQKSTPTRTGRQATYDEERNDITQRRATTQRNNDSTTQRNDFNIVYCPL